MMKKSIVTIWLLACAMIFLATIYLYDPQTGKDIVPVFLWAMIFLTFPSGILTASFSALLVMGADSEFLLPISSTVGLSALWFAFVLIGYVQWFFLIPWLWRKILKK